MINPLTSFYEKDSEGQVWSMTRTVAWLLAVAASIGVVLYARQGRLLNWPTAAAFAFAGLFVPIQRFLSGTTGKKALASILSHLPGVKNG